MWSFSIYATSLAVILMYRRGTPMADITYLSKWAVGAGAILVVSLAARSYSRAGNPTYIKFMKTLHEANSRQSREIKQQLGKYDFEFWAWPVDYKMSSGER